MVQEDEEPSSGCENKKFGRKDPGTSRNIQVVENKKSERKDPGTSRNPQIAENKKSGRKDPGTSRNIHKVANNHTYQVQLQYFSLWFSCRRFRSIFLSPLGWSVSQYFLNMSFCDP